MTTSLKDLLQENPLFDTLASSKLTLFLSFRNTKQHFDFRCKFCNAVYSDHVPNAFGPTFRKQIIKLYHLFSCENCGRRWDPESPEAGVTLRSHQYRGPRIAAIDFGLREFEKMDLELFDFEQTIVVPANKAAPTHLPKTTAETFDHIVVDPDQHDLLITSPILTAGTVLYKNPIMNVLKETGPYFSLERSYRNRSQWFQLQCKFCNALYQEGNPDAFSRSIRYIGAVRNLLSCENCGMRYDPEVGPFVFRRSYDRAWKAFPHNVYEDLKPDLLEIPKPVVCAEPVTVYLKPGMAFIDKETNTLIVYE